MKHENTSFTFVYLYLEIFVVFFWFAVLLHSRASSLTRTAAAAAVAYSRLLYITLFALFQPLSPVCVCMLFTCIIFFSFFYSSFVHVVCLRRHTRTPAYAGYSRGRSCTPFHVYYLYLYSIRDPSSFSRTQEQR